MFLAPSSAHLTLAATLGCHGTGVSGCPRLPASLVLPASWGAEFFGHQGDFSGVVKISSIMADYTYNI